eukprot:534659_1
MEQSTGGQSQHQLIPSSSIVVPDTDNIQSQSNASNTNPNPTEKRNLIVIAVFAAIIVIVVIILICTFEFNTGTHGNNHDDYNPDWYDDYNYDYNPYEVEQIGQVNEICGIHINGTFSSDNCAINCTSQYSSYYAYHIPNTRQCYCQSLLNYNNCFNVTNNTVYKYEVAMIAYGRPYNIDNAIDLKAAFQYINCNDYEFYFHEDQQWMQFINNNAQNVSINIINSWMQKAFSEHASIGSFAKFALDLMSLGAPLWFLETANKAALDEIEHTKISFDILNMYLRNNMFDNVCIMYKEFPSHVIDVNGDWNRISMDTAIGGCIGETLSAFTYLNDDVNDNMLNEYLNKIVMDEIRHASFAWVSVKWIIDHKNDVNVADVEWWDRELVKRSNGTVDYVQRKVYVEMIPDILNLIWNTNQNNLCVEDNGYYKKLYGVIEDMMRVRLKTIRDNVSCAM